jgi:hypothetical protein
MAAIAIRFGFAGLEGSEGACTRLSSSLRPLAMAAEVSFGIHHALVDLVVLRVGEIQIPSQRLVFALGLRRRLDPLLHGIELGAARRCAARGPRAGYPMR